MKQNDHGSPTDSLTKTSTMLMLALAASFSAACGAADDAVSEPLAEHEDPLSLATGAELGPSQPLPGTSTLPVFSSSPPAFGMLPGEFTLRTFLKDTYLTARDGGRHSIDAVITTATTPGVNERYRIETFQPSYVSFHTSGNYFVSARGNGGIGGNNDDTQTLQTERQGLADDILWRLNYNSAGTFSLKTYGGNLLTALGGGGKSTRAFHTDATQWNTWENFWISKCGALGSGYIYAIKPAGEPNSMVSFLSANGGGGKTVGAMTAFAGLTGNAKFTLIQQADGTYAIRTPNGLNYLTAVGAGGIASGDNLHTDATQVKSWEKFRFVDQGNCTYSIQTTSGYFLGVKLGGGAISTAVYPLTSPPAGFLSTFELIMLPFG
jgi:hypothetical protein